MLLRSILLLCSSAATFICQSAKFVALSWSCVITHCINCFGKIRGHVKRHSDRIENYRVWTFFLERHYFFSLKRSSPSNLVRYSRITIWNFPGWLYWWFNKRGSAFCLNIFYSSAGRAAAKIKVGSLICASGIFK